MVVYLRSDKDEEFRRGLLLRTRFLDPSFIGEGAWFFCTIKEAQLMLPSTVSSTFWMVAQALRHGSPLPHVTMAPLESRLNSTNLGLLVPKADQTPVRHSDSLITGDAFRDALLHNLSKTHSRKRQRWTEASVEDGVYPMFDQQHLSRPGGDRGPYGHTPGAQTPVKDNSSTFTLTNRRNLPVPSFSRPGSPPGSIPLSPINTRNDAGAHSNGLLPHSLWTLTRDWHFQNVQTVLTPEWRAHLSQIDRSSILYWTTFCRSRHWWTRIT